MRSIYIFGNKLADFGTNDDQLKKTLDVDIPGYVVINKIKLSVKIVGKE